ASGYGDFGGLVPEPPNPNNITTEDIVRPDLVQVRLEADQLYNTLNDRQREAFDVIKAAVLSARPHPQCFYIDGPAGSGKTYLYETLYKYLISRNKKVRCVAWTGIAASLLPEGRTVHSTFRLPVSNSRDCSSLMEVHSDQAIALGQCDVII